MPIRDAVTTSGKERERSSRITPSDVADAQQQAARDGGPLGARLLDARASDALADGPISDDER